MRNDRTVFVVDDDPAARESVAALVLSKGLQVEEFESAEGFLSAYDRRKQGCLVVDVRMTGMTGLELQDKLTREQIVLPVIVITGYANVPMAVRAMQAGAVTFLEKPCTQQLLWTSIDAALEIEDRERQQSELRKELTARLATLNRAEQIVMGKVVEGLANKRIAAELDIGLRTVELRRSNVMKAMRADSLAELVRMAILIDFLPPE